MLARPRQSRSPPLALCNNLPPDLYGPFHSGEPRQLICGILSRRRIMILHAAEARSVLSRSSHVCRMKAAQNAIALIIDMRFISRRIICDVSTRALVLQLHYGTKKRETILHSAWNVKSRSASGDLWFSRSLRPDKGASTWHGKITLFFRASYHQRW